MINDPGTKAYYCSGGVSVVGRLVENAVHMRLPEFAQANLFGPLGISSADWVWNYIMAKIILPALMTARSRSNAASPAR